MLPSGSEYLIIFGAALLLFGPSKLPALGKALGEGINNFRKGIGGKEEEKNKEGDRPAASPAAKESQPTASESTPQDKN